MLKYVAFPVVENEADLIREFYEPLRSSPCDCLYAILDKVAASGEGDPSWRYAGVISLSATNPSKLRSPRWVLWSSLGFSVRTWRRTQSDSCFYIHSIHLLLEA